MNTFPQVDEIFFAYEDQVEALERLLRGRSRLVGDPQSRFFALSDAEVATRLEGDRNELDRWVVMMLTASFEATIRRDAEARVRQRTKDEVRRPLRSLYEERPDRVRLLDVLEILEGPSTMTPARREGVRTLLKHRHWLAHGRHWANKYGAVPTPQDARGAIEDYLQALARSLADFPLG